MALSNTAVPKYYGEFREKVLNGEIPVCRNISMEMNRIDALIEDPLVFYDDEAIDGFVAFCENELTLTDGSEVRMLDSFKLWAEQLLAWYVYVDRSVYVPNATNTGGHFERRRILKRLKKKQFLIVGRGAAKSMYASYQQSYALVIDTDTTHQIVTAPTMRQSEEIVNPIRTAITKSPGPLFKFLTEGSNHNTRGGRGTQVKLASTKLGIQNFLTNSRIEVRAMTIDKLQGLRPKVTTVDEWLSGDIREDVIGAIEQGASKDDMDYLIIAVSSEGTVRNGAGDDIKMELQEILRGEYNAPHVSIWMYQLDDPRPRMIFWPRGSESRPRGTRTSSRTRRPKPVDTETTPRCPALWVLTCPRAMTSAHSRSCSHYGMVPTESRTEAILQNLPSRSFLLP